MRSPLFATPQTELLNRHSRPSHRTLGTAVFDYTENFDNPVGLTRAAGALASAFHAKARTGTNRRTAIAVPARIASSARRLHLHLPARWPWAHARKNLRTGTGHRLRA